MFNNDQACKQRDISFFVFSNYYKSLYISNHSAQPGVINKKLVSHCPEMEIVSKHQPMQASREIYEWEKY